MAAAGVSAFLGKLGVTLALFGSLGLTSCGAPAELAADPDSDDSAAIAEAAASGRVGLSVIGLLSPHYDCNAVVAAFGRAPIAFGYLERTFGEDRRCLNRLLDHANFAAVRVHLWNGPCVRNGRCGSYETLAGETKDSLNRKLAAGDSALLGKLRSDAVRVRDLLKPHLRAGKRYYVSGILEHDVTDAAGARRVVQLLREVFGPLGFKIVNSPYTGASSVGADVREGHGDRPALAAPCIADLDGTEVADFAAYVSRYKSCELVLGWNNQMNCLADGEAFVDPRARTHCPTAATLAPFTRAIQTLLRR